jgi:hypothetical protein
LQTIARIEGKLNRLAFDLNEKIELEENLRAKLTGIESELAETKNRQEAEVKKGDFFFHHFIILCAEKGFCTGNRIYQSEDSS